MRAVFQWVSWTFYQPLGISKWRTLIAIYTLGIPHFPHHLWLLLSAEVWLSGSEPTIIRRSVLVQQLGVRKDPRSQLRCLIEGEIIIIIRSKWRCKLKFLYRIFCYFLKSYCNRTPKTYKNKGILLLATYVCMDNLFDVGVFVKIAFTLCTRLG